MSSIYYPNTGILAVIGRLSLLIVGGAVVFASFAPPWLIPHFVYSYHLEHFAAFYLLALAASGAFVRRDVQQLGGALWIFAFIIEIVRSIEPVHRSTGLVDWFADAAGVTAALVPILVGRFRDRFAPRAPV
jgi:hypothetical protein